MQLAKKTLIVVFVYLLVFKPELIFIPHSINLTFGLLGLLCYLGSPRNRTIIGSKSEARLNPILLAAAPFIIVSLITCLVNFSSDIYFIKYAISLVLGFFATYLLAILFYDVYGTLSPRILLKYYTLTSIIFVIGALVLFLTPSINSVAMSLIRQDEISKHALEINTSFRLLGFGVNFYTAGLTISCVLILMGLCMTIYELSLLERVLYAAAFTFISIGGVMMARITVIGVALGAIIICMGWCRSIASFMKLAISIVCVVAISIFAINLFSENSPFDIENLITFAFGSFKDIYSGGGIANDHSLGKLLDMYKVLPDNILTWVIGDAHWTTDSGYYKGIDVGFLRYVFYFGVIGTVAFLAYNYNVLKIIFNRKITPTGWGRRPVISLFFLTFLLLFKGTADLFFIVLPFYFCESNINRNPGTNINYCLKK